MSQFVVTSGGTMTNLNERRSASLSAALTGNTHRVGTILTSDRGETVFERGATFPDRWRRLGANRWVNQQLAGGGDGERPNMVPIVEVTQRILTVDTGSSLQLNVRQGPGTVFNVVRTLRNGTTVVPTHSAPTIPRFAPGVTGEWFRIGTREWVARRNLRV